MSKTFRIVAPLACFALSFVLIQGRRQSMEAATQRQVQADRSLIQAMQARDAAERLGSEIPPPYLPASREEEAQFLQSMRREIAAAGGTILEWRATAEPYEPPAENAPIKKEIDPVLYGLTRVDSHLKIAGTYESLLRALRALSESSRLYTIKDIEWSREKDGTVVSLSLSRYVGTPSQTVSSAIAMADAEVKHP